MSKRFPITLDIHLHPGGLSEEQALRLCNEEGRGVCDELFAASISFKEGRGLSAVFYSYTATGKMTDDEMFRIWSFMAKRLTESAIPEGAKSICALVWQHWMERYQSPPAPCTHEGGKTYLLSYRYDRHPQGMPIEEVLQKGVAAADAYIIGCIKYPEQRIMFAEINGMDGNGLTDAVLWQVWTLFAGYLSESKAISHSRRVLPDFVFKTIVGSLVAGELN